MTKSKMSKGKAKSKPKTKKYRLLRGTKKEKEAYESKHTNYDNCEKKYCSKELKEEKAAEKRNMKILSKKPKCNYDETMNYKFDKYNQVKISYDFNPMHFPYNKIKTSPCIIEKDKLLNDPVIPVRNCLYKHCKKEQSEYLGNARF